MHAAASSEARRADILTLLLRDCALWKSSLQPENLRLLSDLWPRLDEAQAAQLAQHVLDGPPSVTNSDRRELLIHERLAVLNAAGGRKLPPDAARQLAELEAKWGCEHASRALQHGARFGGVTRISFAGRSDIDPSRMASLTIEELARVLEDPETHQADGFDDLRESRLDAWRLFARQHPSKALRTLAHLGDRDRWPHDVWAHALMGFEEVRRHSARRATFSLVQPLLMRAPATLLSDREVAWAIGFWLPGVAEALDAEGEPRFLELWDSLAPLFLRLDVPITSDTDPLSAAINEPPGRLFQALLRTFFARRPPVGGGIPEDLEPRLRLATLERTPAHLVAQVMLARHLTPLFVTDPVWAKTHLVPLFDWTDPGVAAAVWRGFIAGGPVDPAVMKALREPFLLMLRFHDKAVHRSQEQVWQLLVSAGLFVPDVVEPANARELLRGAEPEARRSAAFQLYRMMPDDRDQASKLWTESIGPWVAEVWPREIALRDPKTSEALALAAVSSGDAFPQAVEAIAGIVSHASEAYRVMHSLEKSAQGDRHPEPTLSLLAMLVGDETTLWPVRDFRRLLDKISAIRPDLARDARLIRLTEQAIRVGG